MIHIDPLITVVAPHGCPDLEEAARIETYEDANLSFDIVGGLRHPELGGSAEILDIVA